MTFASRGHRKPNVNLLSIAFLALFCNSRRHLEAVRTAGENFLSRADARVKIEAWRRAYNQSRLHTVLGWLLRAAYAASAGTNPGGCRPGVASSPDEKPGDRYTEERYRHEFVRQKIREFHKEGVINGVG